VSGLKSQITSMKSDQTNPSQNQQRNCLTCGLPMDEMEVLHLPLNRMMSGFYQCPKGCPVYEAEAHSEDGSPIEIQIIECGDDAAALVLAEQLGRCRLLPIRLYKLPALNSTSCHSLDFWPDMKVIAHIPAPASK
jgi:hypothetical protein